MLVASVVRMIDSVRLGFGQHFFQFAFLTLAMDGDPAIFRGVGGHSV